jgi:hypothetical protein
MRHALTLAAVVSLLVLAPTLAPAREFKGKRPNCPTLEARLAARELQGLPEHRLRGLRNRVARNCVALNEVQVLGSHNSYHIQPSQALLDILLSFDPQFSAWEYSHLDLADQFELQGIRQIELDVFADPAGGLYARRGGLIALGQDPETYIPELYPPGFKVLHVQDIDFETTCLTFVQCLKNLRAWSNRRRGHLPIMVLVEAKDEAIPDPLNFGFAIPVPIGAAELNAIDAEIRSVFGAKRLITPDSIRRGRPTIEQAIQELGWPRLGEVRGKILFALDNGGAKRDAYVAGHPALAGRVMFTDSPPGSPEAAFMKRNDPLPDPSVIQNLVAQGYIVRTRADADTVEARANDTTTRDAALASGAQFVSTDFPVPSPIFGTPYMVEIPGGTIARCNPVNGPASCRSQIFQLPW